MFYYMFYAHILYYNLILDNTYINFGFHWYTLQLHFKLYYIFVYKICILNNVVSYLWSIILYLFFMNTFIWFKMIILVYQKFVNSSYISTSLLIIICVGNYILLKKKKINIQIAVKCKLFDNYIKLLPNMFWFLNCKG